MKYILIFFAVFATFAITTSCTDDSYWVGSSSVSIDPTDETISLALAGYASPWDGRFSLTWEKVDSGTIVSEKYLINEWDTITFDEHWIYSVDEKGSLFKNNRDGSNTRALIGYNNGETYTIVPTKIKIIDGSLYASTANNTLYKGVHSSAGNMKVTAVCIKRREQTAVIIGADVCGFYKPFSDEIKDEIYKRHGIKPENILINASHSHFVPVTQNWETWQVPNRNPDELYMNNIIKQGFLSAVENALINMAPSEISFGRDTVTIGHNRTRIKAETLYDKSVDVVVFTEKKDGKKSLLFLAGCHPVFPGETGHYTISGNFPAYARNHIQKNEGCLNAIFLQGCCADINPIDKAHVSGRKLGERVCETMNKDMEPISGDISCHFDSIVIPITPMPIDDVNAFKKNAEKNKSERDIKWADIMLEHYKNKTMPTSMPIYIQTINIGSWKLVGLSREVTTQYGPAIRALFPDQNVSVAGYCNDVSSYLGIDAHIEAKNYEGYESFFWYAKPNCFPMGTFQKVIETISANKR